MRWISKNKKILIGFLVFEALLLIIYVVGIHYQDMSTTNYMLSGLEAREKAEIEIFLNSVQPFFLPDYTWRNFVPILVVSLFSFFPGRGRWLLLGFSGFLMSATILADKVYYHFFSTIVSLESLKAAHQLWGVKGSVMSSALGLQLLPSLSYLLLIPFGFFMESWMKSKVEFQSVRVKARVCVAVLAFFVGLYSWYLCFAIPFGVFDFKQRVNSEVHFAPYYESAQRYFAMDFGFLSYHAKDVFDTLGSMGSKPTLTDEVVESARQVFWEQKSLNDNNSPYRGIATGRNVVVIEVESISHCFFDLKVNGIEITPNLNELRRQSLSFEHTVDNIGPGGSSDAEFSVMTGFLADKERISSLNYPKRNNFLALPAQLKALGYHTLSFHGYYPSFWSRDINHPKYGIDKMVFGVDFPSEERIGMGVSDEAFFLHCLDFLGQQVESPFFAFLITLSTHHPYHTLPNDFKRVDFGQLNRSISVENLLNLVHYTDAMLGHFIREFERTPEGKNTLFVIYGDHTPPLAAKHLKVLSDLSGKPLHGVREGRIPLLFYLPGLPSEMEGYPQPFESQAVGLHQVFPSILHLLGEDIPFGLYGVHVFQPEEVLNSFSYNHVEASVFIGDTLFAQTGPLNDPWGTIFSPVTNVQSKERQQQLDFLWRRRSWDKTLHRMCFDFGIQEKLIKQESE